MMSSAGNNAIIGTLAGANITSGMRNTLIGASTGVGLNTGSFNTFVGFGSGANGSNNTVIGSTAGNSMTTAADNTIIGVSAGNALTTGSQNTIIGGQGGYELISGNLNTIIGFGTGRSGIRNVSIGCFSGNLMTLFAVDNIAIGNSAGPKLTDGDQNIFIGTQAGANVTNGSRNILIGARSGGIMTSSSDNIAIGADISIPGTNNTLIGSNISVQAGAPFRVTAIGSNSSISATRFNDSASLFSNNAYATIYGNGAFVVSGEAYKAVAGSWAGTSDRRLKSNIQLANTIMCENIMKNLDLKRYTWNDDFNPIIKDRTQLGFIAQEVEEYLPKAISTTQYEGLDDCKLIDISQIHMIMYGALKRSIGRIDELEAILARNNLI